MKHQVILTQIVSNGDGFIEQRRPNKAFAYRTRTSCIQEVTRTIAGCKESSKIDCYVTNPFYAFHVTAASFENEFSNR